MGIDTTIPIIEQIRWERDTAIAQLSQIDKGLGERMDDIAKVVRCKECIWRLGTDCTRFAEVPVSLDDYCSRAERKRSR